MVARAVWKGTLRVSDLACPVSLITAVSSSERIAFHTVNRATGHRLNRQFVDSENGKAVEKDDQVKGYDNGEGDTIVLETEEIASAFPESDKTLSVQQFVKCEAIDDLYFDRPYYLIPSDEAGTTAFAAIRESLAASGVAALARAVLFRRLRTVLVRPHENAMIATLLSYDYQVRQPQDAFGTLKPIKIDREMLGLAEHIIKTKMGTFDPKRFDDRYENAVAEMVRAKLEGKTFKAKPAPKDSKVVNLMDALRASLGGASAEATTAKPKTSTRTRKPAKAQPEKPARKAG